jgi:hypothetical protein
MQIAEQNAASDASVCAEYRVARDVLKAPIIALMLGVLALAPRVVGLADFLTTDEAYHWIPPLR